MFGGPFPPPRTWTPGPVGTQPRGLWDLRQLTWLGQRQVRAGLGAASFAPSVRGSRAPGRLGSELWGATSSGAPSPGLLGLGEAGPAIPTPGHTHRPISRRSSGSTRSSRSRRHRGRRHPRPRSRPTPSAPPSWAPGDGVKRVPPLAPRDGVTPGSVSDAQEYPGGERSGHPQVVPSALSGGKTNSSLWVWPHE